MTIAYYSTVCVTYFMTNYINLPAEDGPLKPVLFLKSCFFLWQKSGGKIARLKTGGGGYGGKGWGGGELGGNMFCYNKGRAHETFEAFFILYSMRKDHGLLITSACIHLSLCMADKNTNIKNI